MNGPHHCPPPAEQHDGDGDPWKELERLLRVNASLHRSHLDIQTKLIEVCTERDKLRNRCDVLENYIGKIIRPWWVRWFERTK